jgi:glutamyl-tRNA synthetase
MVRVRFAPSPTGFLHLGNARTAVFNALFAEKEQGSLILRIDDTDQARSRIEYEKGIVQDLDWLGFRIDEFYRQSERTSFYQEKALFLKETGRLYPCYETPEQLREMRERKRALGLAPVFRKQDAQKPVEASSPHWRLELFDEEVVFQDLIRGTVAIQTSHISDPIVVRADGAFSYLLCSALDDADLKISHVIRGEDHVVNTAIHCQIFEALVVPRPQFAHFSLMLNEKGEKFSKRTGALTLQELRSQGILPECVIASLCAIGCGKTPEVQHFRVKAQHFDLAAFGRASPCFDVKQLFQLNLAEKRKHMASLSYKEYQKMSSPVVPELFWEMIRHQVDSFEEAYCWYQKCQDLPDLCEHFEHSLEDKQYLCLAAAVLPEGGLNQNTWNDWTMILKERTGRKGKNLYHPLRYAIFRQDQGPQMKDLLPFISRDEVLKRLKGAMKA